MNLYFNLHAEYLKKLIAYAFSIKKNHFDVEWLIARGPGLSTPGAPSDTQVLLSGSPALPNIIFPSTAGQSFGKKEKQKLPIRQSILESMML